MVESLGLPLALRLTPGQAHDRPQAEHLLCDYVGDYVIADTSYDAADLLDWIEAQHAVPVIPPRRNRKVRRDYDRHLYQARHLVECFFNKIKWFRRIFTRYEKLDRSYLAFLSFVSSLVWLR